MGAWLARQRALRGITLDELERRTRIPRRSLERLESGVFDGDRDAFARGFVRTVALAIGVDGDTAVSRLDPEWVPAARVRAGRRLDPALWIMLAGLLAVSALAAALASGRLPRPSFEWAAGAPRAVVQRRDALAELAAEEQRRRLRPAPPLPRWLVEEEPLTRIDAWPSPTPTPLPAAPSAAPRAPHAAAAPPRSQAAATPPPPPVAAAASSAPAPIAPERSAAVPNP